MSWALAALLCGALNANAAVPDAAGPPEDMVLVPDGVFTMGSSDADIDWVVKTFFSESREWYLDETPQRRVYLGAFYMDKYEVTNEQYQRFLEAVPGREPKFWDNPQFSKPKQPVVGITWQEAVEYCKWKGKRLPTEEEWEKAARGSDGRYYPWGNENDPILSNVRGMDDGYRYPAPVGSIPEGDSPYGISDLAGNTFEWTTDWYLPYEGNQHENDMYGTELKVIKGGSWHSNMDLARSPIRGKAIPDQRHKYIGFRCVLRPQSGE